VSRRNGGGGRGGAPSCSCQYHSSALLAFPPSTKLLSWEGGIRFGHARVPPQRSGVDSVSRGRRRMRRPRENKECGDINRDIHNGQECCCMRWMWHIVDD
jgi:hypothetical protein